MENKEKLKLAEAPLIAIKSCTREFCNSSKGVDEVCQNSGTMNPGKQAKYKKKGKQYDSAELGPREKFNRLLSLVLFSFRLCFTVLSNGNGFPRILKETVRIPSNRLVP